MIKVAFIVVVSLAIILNVVAWVSEKIYKKKMVAKAKQKEFDVFNENV